MQSLNSSFKFGSSLHLRLDLSFRFIRQSSSHPNRLLIVNLFASSLLCFLSRFRIAIIHIFCFKESKFQLNYEEIKFFVEMWSRKHERRRFRRENWGNIFRYCIVHVCYSMVKIMWVLSIICIFLSFLPTNESFGRSATKIRNFHLLRMTKQLEQQTFEVQGVHCTSCIQKINSVLKEIDRTAIIEGLNPTILRLSSNASSNELNRLFQEKLNTTRYSIHPMSVTSHKNRLPKTNKGYLSLGLLYLLISLLSLLHPHLFSFAFINHNKRTIQSYLHHFMGYFYLIFGLFKIFNYSKFISFYPLYNDVARRFSWYNRLYPFVEIIVAIYFLFIRFFMQQSNHFDNLFSVVISLISSYSSISIARFLLQRNNNKNAEVAVCACLGTVISLPVTWITFGEDILMLLMSLFCLIRR